MYKINGDPSPWKSASNDDDGRNVNFLSVTGPWTFFFFYLRPARNNNKRQFIRSSGRPRLAHHPGPSSVATLRTITTVVVIIIVIYDTIHFYYYYIILLSCGFYNDTLHVTRYTNITLWTAVYARYTILNRKKKKYRSRPFRRTCRHRNGTGSHSSPDSSHTSYTGTPFKKKTNVHKQISSRSDVVVAAMCE